MFSSSIYTFATGLHHVEKEPTYHFVLKTYPTFIIMITCDYYRVDFHQKQSDEEVGEKNEEGGWLFHRIDFWGFFCLFFYRIKIK